MAQPYEKLLGIDLDTNRLAYVEFDLTSDKATPISYREINRWKSKNKIYNPEYLDFKDRIFLKKDLVYIEDIFCFNRKGYRALAEVHGELKFSYLVSSHGSPDYTFFYVQPSTWQKHLDNIIKSLIEDSFTDAKYEDYFGDVTDRKELTHDEVEVLIGGVPEMEGLLESEHTVDAFGIGLYGYYKEKEKERQASK